MNTIGARLREERKRLGLNQSDFATAGGVQKRAQISYEQDERSPTTEYLQLLHQIGVDVSYVLTGAPNTGSLSQDESDLLKAFQALDERGKSGVLALLKGIAPVKQPASVTFHGNVGQVVQNDVTAPQTFNFGGKKS